MTLLTKYEVCIMVNPPILIAILTAELSKQRPGDVTGAAFNLVHS